MSYTSRRNRTGTAGRNTRTPSVPGTSNYAHLFGPEFNLEPMELDDGIPNPDRVAIEHERIFKILNDWLLAQRLRLLHQDHLRLPQMRCEARNREQLRIILKEAAVSNVNRAKMDGVMNNFAVQYCNFVRDRDAVEAQRLENEAEKARLVGAMGFKHLPGQARSLIRVCQTTVIVAIGNTFAFLAVIWSGTANLKASMAATKTAGIQLIVLGVLQIACVAFRCGFRIAAAFARNGRTRLPAAVYGRDGKYLSIWWDGFICLTIGGIIAFGGWMWTKGHRISRKRYERDRCSSMLYHNTAAGTVLPGAIIPQVHTFMTTDIHMGGYPRATRTGDVDIATTILAAAASTVADAVISTATALLESATA
ncbi:hypothetical protein TWF481_000108 [Arthrobotrys musiformis]|uniref:Uncharacterized protein n=1 Tax=Arthrobotrys musiformis TaxID=47236 RepID=A0AAV9WSC1_9PEZI